MARSTNPDTQTHRFQCSALHVPPFILSSLPQMGATVFHHPKSYIAISRQIRSDLSKVSKGTVITGILLNHGYLSGVINRGPDAPPYPLPSTPMAPYSGAWGPLLSFEQWPGVGALEKTLPDVRALLQDEVDFLVRKLRYHMQCMIERVPAGRNQQGSGHPPLTLTHPVAPYSGGWGRF